jgi:TPR repeat protein
VALYRQSAADGEIRSYAKLGDLYANGDAVPRDEAQAIEWYTRAAEQGDPKGMYRLGQAHERGRGVDTDLVVALMWYHLAAQGEYEPATRGVERIEAKLAPQDTERAAQLAEAWQQDQG